MAKINDKTKFPQDSNVSGEDFWISTSSDTNETKTLTVDSVTEYVEANIAGGGGTDDQTASEVPIVDTGALYTAIDVEGALAEVKVIADAAGVGSLSATDINTLAKLNTIVTDATLADKGVDDNFVTDAEKVVIGNTGGTNSGDQDISGISTNATAITSKQNTLVSGTNIKTINGESLLGSTDIVIAGGTDDQTASEVPIVDTGALYTATDVEGALAEVKVIADAATGEVNTINSTTVGEPIGSDVVLNIVSLTQAEYDAGIPVDTTNYLITDAAAPDELTLDDEVGTTYTYVLANQSQLVTHNNAASIAATVPTNAVAAFPIGAQINIYNKGAGLVTVGGAGVTINTSSTLVLRAQHSMATLIKIATDEWILTGDLTAV